MGCPESPQNCKAAPILQDDQLNSAFTTDLVAMMLVPPVPPVIPVLTRTRISDTLTASELARMPTCMRDH